MAESRRVRSVRWLRGTLLLLILAPARDAVPSEWRRIPMNPEGRAAGAMAYDRNRHVVVLVGGLGKWDTQMFDVLSDTWEYDGVAWRPGPLAPRAMTARSHHAMVYDASRGAVVVFGGRTVKGLAGDTWLYDGTTWAPGAAAPAGLSPRWGHAMAYDTDRSRVVLFGGLATGGLVADTWELGPAGWSSVAAVGPGPRHGHAMAYDAARSRAVLLGGMAGVASLGDVWSFDGASWTSLPGGPPARSFHGMAYDTDRGVVVAYGGVGSGGALGDVWELGSAGWSAGAAGTPSFQHAMAFDEARGSVVAHGGAVTSTALLGSTREYAGGWNSGTTPSAGVVRADQGALVYDVAADELFFYDWVLRSKLVFGERVGRGTHRSRAPVGQGWLGDGLRCRTRHDGAVRRRRERHPARRHLAAVG